MAGGRSKHARTVASTDHADLVRRLLEGRNRGDSDNEVIESLGYSVLWGNGVGDHRAAAMLRVHIGASSVAIGNSVVLNLPEPDAVPNLYTRETAHKLLCALVQLFNPDSVLWSNQNLLDEQSEPDRPSEDGRGYISGTLVGEPAGWANYLSDSNPVRFDATLLPASATVEQLGDGTLLTLASDPANPPLDDVFQVRRAMGYEVPAQTPDATWPPSSPTTSATGASPTSPPRSASGEPDNRRAGADPAGPIPGQTPYGAVSNFPRQHVKSNSVVLPTDRCDNFRTAREEPVTTNPDQIWAHGATPPVTPPTGPPAPVPPAPPTYFPPTGEGSSPPGPGPRRGFPRWIASGAVLVAVAAAGFAAGWALRGATDTRTPAPTAASSASAAPITPTLTPEAAKQQTCAAYDAIGRQWTASYKAWLAALPPGWTWDDPAVKSATATFDAAAISDAAQLGSLIAPNTPADVAAAVQDVRAAIVSLAASHGHTAGPETNTRIDETMAKLEQANKVCGLS